MSLDKAIEHKKSIEKNIMVQKVLIELVETMAPVLIVKKIGNIKIID